jgi:lysophospholipase L1-like esterase
MWNPEFKFYGVATYHPMENLGYGGYKTADILTNIDSWLDTYFPSYVQNPYLVLMCGTNDVGAGTLTATSMSNYSSILDAVFAHNPNITVISCLCVPWDDGDYDAKIDTYNAALTAMITAYGNDSIILCDPNTAFKLNASWSTLYYTVDHIHPNDMGYFVLASEIFKYLPHMLSTQFTGIRFSNISISGVAIQ